LVTVLETMDWQIWNMLAGLVDFLQPFCRRDADMIKVCAGRNLASVTMLRR